MWDSPRQLWLFIRLKSPSDRTFHSFFAQSLYHYLWPNDSLDGLFCIEYRKHCIQQNQWINSKIHYDEEKKTSINHSIFHHQTFSCLSVRSVSSKYGQCAHLNLHFNELFENVICFVCSSTMVNASVCLCSTELQPVNFDSWSIWFSATTNSAGCVGFGQRFYCSTKIFCADIYITYI